MSYTVSITSQGQISIPALIRKQLGLSKNSKAIISVKGGEMLVRPVKDFLELKGSVNTKKKPLTKEELHDFFAQELVKENS